MPMQPTINQGLNDTRTRDVVTLFKGKGYPVLVDSTMMAGGWPGGQGVTWVDSPNDQFLVSYSSGTYGGMLLWGSNESSDQLIAYESNQVTYGFATLCVEAWVVMTKTFETYTYESRTGGGPLVPNVFTVGGRLRFSLRGYFTPEDEWTLSGDPRAPNNFYVGHIIQAPTPAINNYMTVQTSF